MPPVCSVRQNPYPQAKIR